MPLKNIFSKKPKNAVAGASGAVDVVDAAIDDVEAAVVAAKASHKAGRKIAMMAVALTMVAGGGAAATVLYKQWQQLNVAALAQKSPDNAMGGGLQKQTSIQSQSGWHHLDEVDDKAEVKVAPAAPAIAAAAKPPIDPDAALRAKLRPPMLPGQVETREAQADDLKRGRDTLVRRAVTGREVKLPQNNRHDENMQTLQALKAALKDVGVADRLGFADYNDARENP